MGRNLIETIMGAVVLAVAGFFLIFAYRHADLNQVEGYEITAQFAGLGGLDVGADIRINGIKVGTVAGQNLDPATFAAVVHLSIANDIHLPVDTVATIAADGLLGGKYIKLIPGRSDQRIPAGGKLTQSRDYRSIEEMVGQLIFLATSEQQPPPPPPVAPPPAAPAAEPVQPAPTAEPVAPPAQTAPPPSAEPDLPQPAAVLAPPPPTEGPAADGQPVRLVPQQ